MEISKIIRESVKKESGILRLKILKVERDSHGYPNLLLSGKDNSGFEWRGWLNEGEGAASIKWDSENRDGWPSNLQA